MKRLKRQSRRRGALIGLAAHGMSYGIVMSGLAIVDVMSGPGWWFQWRVLLARGCFPGA
ncbi:hypothetical protein [Cystobacter fuscus]|uniref:hypothetical protein n=1 Tax=Cystobacter fuscus TaxID=43 RepID=UPI0037C0B03A